MPEPLLTPSKALALELRPELPREGLGRAPPEAALGLEAGDVVPVEGRLTGEIAPVVGLAPGPTFPVVGRLLTAPVLGKGDFVPAPPPDPQPRASCVAGLAPPEDFNRL